MTKLVDVFDLLCTVHAEDDADVHLAPFDWAEPPKDATLCGLVVTGDATTSFHKSACLRCASRALGIGIYAVRNGTAVVNLSRLIASRRTD